MRTILFAMILTASAAASASDHWDSCSSAEGSVKIENGILEIAGYGEIEIKSSKEVSVIKTELQKCTLKNSKYEVVSYSNTVSVEEVTYNVDQSETDSSAFVICERGGSGIPANDSCKE